MKTEWDATRWPEIRDQVRAAVPARVLEAAKLEAYGRRRKGESSWAFRMPGFSWECVAKTREAALAECWSAVLNELGHTDDGRAAELRAAWTPKPAPLTGWRVGDAGLTVFGPKVEGAIAPRVILTGKDRAAVRLAAAAPELLESARAVVQEWKRLNPAVLLPTIDRLALAVIRAEVR